MFKLPKVPYTMDKDQSVQIPFRGINYSDMLTDGDVADSRGISMRRYPFITTRRGRELNADASNKKTDTIFPYNGELASVRGGVLYKGEDAVTYKDANETEHEHVVGSGAKFAKINSKLVSFSGKGDKALKKYYDTNKEFIDPVSGELVPVPGELEAKVEAEGVTFKKNGVEAEFVDEVKGQGGTFKNGTFCTTSTSKIVLPGAWMIDGYYAWHVIQVSSAFKQEYTSNGYHCYEWEFANDDNIVSKLDGEVKIIFAYFDEDDYDFFYMLEHSYIETTQDSIVIKSEKQYYLQEDLNKRLYISCAPDYNLNEKIRTGISVCFNDGVENKITAVGENYFCAADKNESYISFWGYFDGLSLTATSKWDDDLTKFIKNGDVVKFNGSKNNTDSYTVVSVTKDTITFSNKDVIDDESSIWTNFYIWKAWSNDTFSKFKKGDAVTIEGCDALTKNNITFVIDSLSGAGIYAAADIFDEGYVEGKITISRKVPDLDFICESENRLWGCNSAENTVYVSALGDPTNMYAYEGVSTDSFATAVGSEGDFTGCCKYGSSVLFFKEDRIHKFLGSYPAEYTLYSYEVDGVQAGSEKSLVVINEVLYYKGTYGVYAYDGGVPRLISECFGDRSFYNAVAGTDGVNYYISMKDEKDVSNGQWYLFVYNTRTGMWVLEDHIQSRDFARVGRTLYYLGDGGNVWSLDNGCTVDKEVKTVDKEVKTVDKPIEWMVQFTPFYETIEGRKSYSRILMRAEVPLGSYIELKIRCDDGRWAELGRIVGKMRGVVPIRIPINRCDKFELRLEGKGECTIHSMLREYCVGGER